MFGYTVEYLAILAYEVSGAGGLKGITVGLRETNCKHQHGVLMQARKVKYTLS